MGASLTVTSSAGGQAYADNVTRIVHPQGSGLLDSAASASAWRLRGTSSATIDQLKTYASANTTLVTTTITVRKAGAAQSLLVTYTSGQTGEKQDTTHSFSASAGDDIDVEVAVPNDVSGAKSITLHSMSWRVTPATGGDTVSRIGQNTSRNFATASTTYYGVAGNFSNTTTERALGVLSTYTLSNLVSYVSANARTTTTTIRSRKNGANGNQVVTYTSGQTGTKEDTTNSDSLTSGDNWCMSLATGTGTGTLTAWNTDVTVYSASGEFDLVSYVAAGTSIGSSSTSYYAPGAAVGSTTTEANVQFRGFAADYKNLRAYLSSNSSNSTITVTWRVEGADSALTVSYTTGQTGLKTNTSSVAAADDDLLGWKVVNAGTGAATLIYLAITGVASSGGGTTIEDGALATSTDDAFTGTGAALADGSLATTTEASLSGTGVAVVVGSLATEGADAFAGGGLVLGAGSIADAPDDAHAGSGVALGAGAVADEADAAESGTGVAVAPGALGEEDAAGLAGGGAAVTSGELGLDVDAGLAGVGLVAGAGALGDDLAEAWSGLSTYIGLGAYAAAVDSALAGADLVLAPVVRVILRGDVTMARDLIGAVTIARELVGDVTLSRALSDSVEV